MGGADFSDDDPRSGTSAGIMPMRPPAGLGRFPVLAGFLVGAPTDTIARSIARGERWEVGLASAAPPGALVIWLLDLALPYARQVAAWRSP
jgi:hypothetical protein